MCEVIMNNTYINWLNQHLKNQSLLNEINWAAVNPILLEGEMGLDTTLNCLKIGDGVTVWNSLPYFICQGATGPAS